MGYLHWQELQGFSVYMTKYKYKYKYKYKLTNFWSILMSNALQGTSQHLSHLQKVFFISIFGTFMICSQCQLEPSSSLLAKLFYDFIAGHSKALKLTLHHSTLSALEFGLTSLSQLISDFLHRSQRHFLLLNLFDWYEHF